MMIHDSMSGDGEEVIDARYLKDIKFEGMWGKEKNEVHVSQGFLWHEDLQGRRVLELRKLVFFVFLNF